MTPFKIEPGHFRVVRMCCRDGNCLICLGGFNRARRGRIIQLDRLSETSAKAVALNWAGYDAVVEAMPCSAPPVS